MGDVLLTVAGIVLIAVTMRDVVHELFHPEATGSISRVVMHTVWQALRGATRLRPSAVRHAGPFVLIAVAMVWGVLMVVGWALVFLPHLPEGFLPTPGLPPHERHGLWTALYLSMASITTLGASGLTPQIDGLRYATALESLLGLVMFTAWITWVLSVYPVLAERRAFARQVGVFRAAHPSPAATVAEAPRDAVSAVLLSLSRDVLQVGVRLCQSHVTYYFHNDSPETTLAAQLPYVLDLARAAEERGPEPGIRHNGRMLRLATEETLSRLGTQFLGMPKDAPPEKVLDALARDHLIDVADEPA